MKTYIPSFYELKNYKHRTQNLNLNSLFLSTKQRIHLRLYLDQAVSHSDTTTTVITRFAKYTYMVDGCAYERKHYMSAETHQSFNLTLGLITFRVSRRRRKM